MSALLGSGGLVVGSASSAHATYSIIAADAASMEVGGAGTSCVGPLLSIITIYGSAPGTGAVVAQARVNEAGRDEAVRLLQQGSAPSDIIAVITSDTFDPPTFFGGAEQRQYAVVDVLGRSAGFTGSETMEYADDLQFTFGQITYSVQGNILTGPAVLDQARAAFEAPACDLAERLMSALEEGAANGQGDSRCTPDGIPSDGAFIQVDRPGQLAGQFLRLEVRDTAPNSPVSLLREQFDAWRGAHPCLPPEDLPDARAPADAEADAAGGGATVDSGAGVEPTGSAGGGGSAAVPQPGAGAPSAGGTAAAPTTLPPAGGLPPDASDSRDENRAVGASSSGCACRFGLGHSHVNIGFAAFITALAAYRRRRRGNALSSMTLEE